MSPETCVNDGLALENNPSPTDDKNKKGFSSLTLVIEKTKGDNRRKNSFYQSKSLSVFKETKKKGISEPMIARASALILALLEVRRSIMGNELDKDSYKGQPQTMQWYKYVFSSGLEFHEGCIERYRAPTAYSRHMVVLIGEAMYHVELLRYSANGEEFLPCYAEIKVCCLIFQLNVLNFVVLDSVCKLGFSQGRPGIFCTRYLFNIR